MLIPVTPPDSSQDEIDVELLGGDPSHWQTNMFAPPSPDAAPEYGTFSSVEDVNNIEVSHTYTIDWDPVRIEWSVDGRVVRTLTKGRQHQLSVLRLLMIV